MRKLGQVEGVHGVLLCCEVEPRGPTSATSQQGVASRPGCPAACHEQAMAAQ